MVIGDVKSDGIVSGNEDDKKKLKYEKNKEKST